MKLLAKRISDARLPHRIISCVHLVVPARVQCPSWGAAQAAPPLELLGRVMLRRQVQWLGRQRRLTLMTRNQHQTRLVGDLGCGFAKRPLRSVACVLKRQLVHPDRRCQSLLVRARLPTHLWWGGEWILRVNSPKGREKP